jgi:SAM-dependent methyltransferase
MAIPALHRAENQHAVAVIGAGWCGVCGHIGEYVVTDAPTRENHSCSVCNASLRYRNQAQAIASTFGCRDVPLSQLPDQPEFRELVLYEPGIEGPLRQFLQRVPHYINSYFWPGVPPGTEHDGVRCEDLRDLTLADESVDLVVSSDIFEHVRDPMPAFAELFRVLRPGGHHIFTVPIFWPFSPTSTARVDWSGPEDVFLMDPVYHGSPTDPRGSLVYTDFGMDLPEQLREIGFETCAHHGYRNAVTFVSRKPANTANI